MKKSKQKIYSVGLFFFIAVCASAQQMPVIPFNPDMQGIILPAAVPSEYFVIGQRSAVGVSYRSSLGPPESSPATYAAWIDGVVCKKASGFKPILGVYTVSDKFGPSQQTGIYGRLAVGQFQDKWGIAVGFSGGYQHYGFKLTEDMFVQSKDPFKSKDDPSVNYGNWNAGVFGYFSLSQNDNFFLFYGIGIGQMNRSQLTILTKKNPYLGIENRKQTTLMLGFIKIFKGSGGKKFIEPRLWLQHIDSLKAWQMTIQIRWQCFEYVFVKGGFSTRLSRALKDKQTTKDNSASYAHLGFGFLCDKNNRLRLTYGFNYGLSAIALQYGSTHEFGASYTF